MKAIKCKECGKLDCIYSIEIITTRFDIYASDDGEIVYDGTSGKDIYAERECFMCYNCEATYQQEHDIEEMIVEVKIEEEEE